MFYIYEKNPLKTSNPLFDDPNKPITESNIQDLKLQEVRAVYPMITAINSNRLTRNFTLYPRESLVGKKRDFNPTGYSSFVKPFGKPILKEHRLQDSAGFFGGGELADVPMGRIIYAAYRKREKSLASSFAPRKGVPGTMEGDGSLVIVPGIVDEDAIVNVLGGAYHTVSIGAMVEKIVESISGIDIAAARKSGDKDELPPYHKGQWYDGKLSYWTMGPIQGLEVSFVNNPSDELAFVEDRDIGVSGLRLLLGEKKNNHEFCFYDAKSGELVKIETNDDEFEVDSSFEFVDSASVGRDVWWVSESAKVTKKEKVSQIIREVLDVKS